jgi:hypothetical protein
VDVPPVVAGGAVVGATNGSVSGGGCVVDGGVGPA